MIYITEQLIRQIQSEGERCYPDECCGILYGTLEDVGKKMEKRVLSIQPVTNSFSTNEKHHRFLITSEMMMQAELEARKRGLDIVGFYHSHPGKPAYPSEYDRAHALPIYSYIITSVVFDIAVEVNSFELSAEENRFCPEYIILEENNQRIAE